MINDKRKFFPLVLIGLITCSFLWQGCDTEGNLDPDYKDYYVRFFGDEGSQEGIDLVIDERDKSVMLLGTTTVPGTSNRRLFLVKADWEGNVIWKKKLGGPYDIAKDIEFSNDGGFIILSEYSKDVQLSQGLGVKLIKITPDGTKTDSTTYNEQMQNGLYPSAYPATVTAINGGYIVTGSTEYGTNWADGGSNNISDIIRIVFVEDLQVNVNFDRYFRLSDNDFGYKAVTVAGNFFTLGTSQDAAENNNYNIGSFVNEGGQTGTEFQLGSNDNDEILKAVCPSLSPGGYFLVGTHSTGPNVSDIYIAYTFEDDGRLKKAPGDGTVIKIPLNTNRKITPTSCYPSNSGQAGYLILGTEGDDLQHNIWLCKVGDVSAGSQVYWSSIFGASDRNDDRAGAVAELPDGRILVVGTVNLGVNNLKMGLFKLNNQGKFAN